MRWTGHAAHMGAERNAYRVLVGKPEKRVHLGNLDTGGSMDLKEIE
jgi:hypothetical protein